MQELFKSSTSYPILFFMTDSSDHLSGKTGLSPTVTISKNGAAFASPSGAVSEIANGWYKIAGNATDTNTAGPLALHATGTGADAYDGMCIVKGVDPGIANVPANVTQLLGTAWLTPGVAGTPDVNALQIGGTAQTGRDLGKIPRAGTAQAGAGSTITLDAGASSTNDLYKGLIIYVYGGTGAGQVRTIIGYVGSTKVATVDRAWATNPDSTSTFFILPLEHPALSASLGATVSGYETGQDPATLLYVTPANKLATDGSGNVTPTTIESNISRSGTAQAGAASTITLDAGASSVTDFYKGQSIHIYGNTGAGQTRTISAYNGSTKVATVGRAWATNPDNTSLFVLMRMTSPLLSAALGVTVSGYETGQDPAALLASGVNLSPTHTNVLHSGTAQAGGATSITLAAGASAVDGFYVGGRVRIHTATALGQIRTITGYNGTTKVATVDYAWAVNPDATSQYAIQGVGSAPRLDSNLLVDITANTILAIAAGLDANSSDLNSIITTLATFNDILSSALVASVNDGSPTAGSFIASSALAASTDFYLGSVVCFTSGTLRGKAELVTGYDGATRRLTFATIFPQAPGNGDKFIITGRIQ